MEEKLDSFDGELQELSTKIGELEQERREKQEKMLELGLSDEEVNLEKRIKAILTGFKGHRHETVNIEALHSILMAKGHEPKKISETIESLKAEGELFNPKQGYIQKI